MSNLLEKASILLTPTAYDDGKVLSVKPEDGTGDFDFTRNSSATRVNSQGLIEDVQTLSSNLVSNGDFSQEGSQLVTNGDFSQEGSEEITNGDFSNGSTDWELNPSSGTAIVSNGKLNFTNSTSQGTQVQQRDRSYVIGKTYKITFTVTDYIQGGVRLSLGNNLTTSVSANGTFTQYITYTSGLNRTYIYTNGSTLSIDNVSVKEVGQDWTLGTGWSIGTNKVIGDGTMGGNDVVRQIINFSQGTTYRFSFTVLDYISGGVFIRNPFNGYLDIASANGSYSFDYVAGINDYIDFRGNSFVGSITNVSVKEVGQDWTLGTGVTIGENKAIFTSTASGQSVSQNAVASSLTNGALAKVSFEVLSRTQGSFGVYFSGTLVGTLASAGVFTGYFTKGTETSFYIRALGTTSGSISNISVIEITDDTNLPRINYEGFSYQDSLGSELVVNGDFATDSNWFKDANWTIANDKATSTGGGRMFQSIPFLETNIGTTVKVSFDIIDITANGVVVNCYGGVSQLFTTVGTHTFTTTTTNNTNLYFNNAGAGNLIGSIDNVSVKEYLGQEVVPDSGCGSWLFEPQSTNSVTYSEDFTQWGQNGAPTLTSGQLAPDGTLGATKISGTIGSSNITLSLASSVTATRTIYAKTVSGTGTAKLMSYSGNTNNLFTLTEEWQRFELTGSSSVGGTTFYIDFRDFSQTLSEFIIWGAQSEELSYPTSYIPTNGSTVTRLQDAAFGAGSSDLINSTEGVLYAEIAALANGGVGDRYISLGSGSDVTNTVQLLYHNTANRINFRVTKGGSFQVNISDFTFEQTENLKIAVKFKANDFALWINGVERVTDTSGQTFDVGTLQKLQFDSGNRASDFFGKIKCLAVFKEALTDAELTCLTTDAELEFLTTDETSYSSSTALAPEAVSYYYYSGDGSGQSNLELNNEGLPILDNSNIKAAVDAYLNGDLDDIELWDVSNVTIMFALFQGASSFNQDISNWDVSNLTNMSSMFLSASSFNQDISSWDVSNVTNMAFMFTDASSFNQSIGNWDTSNLNIVGYMFYRATSFNQDISNWDITNITYGSNGYFMGGVTLSTANYDNLLIDWAAKMLVAYPGGSGYNLSPSWGFGTSIHTIGGDAETAKNTLVNTFNWTITDGN